MGAEGALLERVAPSPASRIDTMHTSQCFRYEPDAVVNVTIAGLATASPWTEQSLPAVGEFGGLIVPRGIFGGLLWTRVDAGAKSKVSELAPGRPVRWGDNLFLGQEAAAYGTTAYLECYNRRAGESWKEFYDIVRAAGGAGMPSGPRSGAGSLGSDVTLGTFTVDNTAAVQVFKAGTRMPAAGATVPGRLILNAAPGNTTSIYVAETSALAVASNGELGPAGQDEWSIPAGGTLYILGATAVVQTVSGRFRS